MTFVKASYTRQGGKAKAAVRYIENRRGRDGAKLQRTLFTADGKVERAEAYTVIDQAAPGSYFYRLAICPDPRREDSGKNLSLRELTEQTIRSLEDYFRQPLSWVAAVHADHAEHRHVHALVIVPQRLEVPHLRQLRNAATAAARAQVHHFTLAREQQAHSQEGWSW